MKSDKPRTIIKFTGTERQRRVWRDLFALVLILGGLLALFGAFGAFQVFICQKQFPNATAKECLLKKNFIRQSQ